MMKLSLFCLSLFMVITQPVLAQDNKSSNSLQSDELQEIKSNYEKCVFDKGRIIMLHSSFKDAIEYAPMACRKQLLKSKKYLLDSAFKVDVINELVSSIEEGVRIDLVNMLIQEMQKDTK